MITWRRLTAGAALAAMAALTMAGRAYGATDRCGDAYMAGYQQLEAKQYPEARKHFEESLAAAEKPWQRGACLYRIGECFENEGDLARAVEQYAAAARTRREDRQADNLGQQRYLQDAIERLAAVAPKAGQAPLVREVISGFLADFPNVSEGERSKAYQQAMESFVGEGKPNEAAAYVEARIGDDKYATPPVAGELRLGLGRLLEKSGEFKVAAEAYAAAAQTPGLEPRLVLDARQQHAELLIRRLGRPAEGRQALAELLAGVDPNRRADMRLSIADSYAQEDDPDSACAAYEALVRDGQCPAPRRRQAATELVKIRERQDRRGEARAFLERAIAEAFSDADSRLHLWRLLYDVARRDRNDEAALQACERMMALEHDDARTTASWRREALRRRADVWWGQGKRAEAIGELEKALAVEPGDVGQQLDLRLRIGQWESERGNANAAYGQFNYVLEHAGDDVWKAYWARVQRSDAYRRERRFDEAAAAVHQALEAPQLHDNHRADLLFRLGEIRRDQEQLTEAVAACDRITGLPAVSADWKCRAIERAADHLQRQGKPDQAAERLRAAVSGGGLEPRHQSTLWVMLMRVERGAGHDDQAIEAARQIIALEVNGGHVREATQALESLQKK